MNKPSTESGYRAAVEALIRTRHRLESEIAQAQREIAIRQGLVPDPVTPRPLRIELPKYLDGLQVQWEHHRRQVLRLERELAQFRDKLEIAKPVRKPNPSNPFTSRSRSHEQRQIRNSDPAKAKRMADQARALGYGDQIMATGIFNP